MTSTTRTTLIKFVSVAAAVALAVGVAGCSDEPKPKHAAATPSPTASTTPEKPELPKMPDAARAHTKAGARAFTEYFVETVSYANQTLNTGPFEAIADDHCDGCNGAIHFLGKWRKKGAVTANGQTTVKSIEVAANSRFAAIVNVSMRHGAHTIRLKSGKVVFKGSAGIDRQQLFLTPQQPAGWLISSLVVRGK